jgi:hypothetical protein
MDLPPGPLLGLIEEHMIVEDIENRIIEAGGTGKLTADERAVVRRFIYGVVLVEAAHERVGRHPLGLASPSAKNIRLGAKGWEISYE